MAVLVTLVAAAAVAAPAARQGNPPPSASASSASTGTARIHGRVVAADTGAPVRRAVVTLMRTAALSTLADGRSATAPLANFGRWVVTTDDEGAFDFRELPAGSFNFSVTKSGFVETSFALFPSTAGSALQEKQTLNRGDLRLPRGGVIAGRIIDEQGEPVAGATVNALRVNYLGPGSRRLAAAQTIQTNDLGDYRLYGLQPGSYFVAAGFRQWQVSGGEGVPPVQFLNAGRGLVPTFYPGTILASDAQTVTVVAGEDTPGVGIRLLSVPLARVDGTVVDSQGRPAQKVAVMLNPARADGAMSMNANVIEVDANGRFSLTNVAPGDYEVDVVARAKLEALGRGSAEETSSEFASQFVSVAGDITDLVVRMTTGFDVSGRVLVDGAPPSAALGSKLRVDILPQSSLGTLFGASGPVTADGTFAIPGSIGGRRIRVRGLPADAAVVRILARGMDVTDDFLEIDQVVSGVEIAITTKPTRITGTVTDPAGAAVSQYAVIAFSEDSRLWTKVLSRYVATALPAADGGFAVVGLPPGRYLAVAVGQLEPGQWADPANLEKLKRLAVPFAVTDGETKVLTLIRR